MVYNVILTKAHFVKKGREKKSFENNIYDKKKSYLNAYLVFSIIKLHFEKYLYMDTIKL